MNKRSQLSVDKPINIFVSNLWIKKRLFFCDCFLIMFVDKGIGYPQPLTGLSTDLSTSFFNQNEQQFIICSVFISLE